MKKLFLLILSIIIVVVLIVLSSHESKPHIVIDGKYFSVDVARTDLEKQKGLAIYDELPNEKGMIFPFQKSDYYSFWMKDMKFPIDIIYINDNKIVDIFKNVPVPNFQDETLPILRPKSPSSLVLEINAGLSEKYRFKIGDLVKVIY